MDASWRRPAALAALTASTLLGEVALTRLMSIAYFPHVAFLVLSTAMLGTGVAAAVQSLFPIADDVVARAQTAVLMVGAGVAFLVGHAAVHLVGAEPLAVSGAPAELVRLGIALLALALPFAASGAAVTRLLTARGDESFRMYAADLGGAALGCALAVPAMNVVGPRGAIFVAAAVAGGGASLLLPSRKGAVALAAGALLGLAASPAADRLLPLHISSAKVTQSGEPFARVLQDPRLTRESEETAHPRLDLVAFTPSVHRVMFDAGVAAVRVPRGPTRTPHDATVTYELRPGSPTLVIGAGAGWEVQEALHFTRARIDAVEIHPGVMRYVPPRLRAHDRVTWHVEDGRTFVESTSNRYGSIIMIHTISNAASAAGALHLSESYLLTVRAAEALIERLDPHGLLLVTRPESQIARWVATLQAAAPAAPVHERVIVWREPSRGSSFYGAVLYAKDGFRPGDLDEVGARVESRGLELLHAPAAGEPADSLVQALGRATGAASRQRLDPVTDDRPFFNQRIAFSNLELRDFTEAFGAEDRARMALEDTPFAETSAVLVLLEVLAIGGLAILLPFAFGRGPGADFRSESGARRRIATAHLVFYPALGLGFMMVEIALIQKLGILSGSPTRTLAIVLGGLLLGAGLGARAAAGLRQGAAAIGAVGVGVGALGLWWLGSDALIAAASLPLVGRLAVSAGFAFFVGLALGIPFPLGLARSGRLGPRWAAWGFALNAVASVGAPVLALILATEVGFGGVLLTAAAGYLAAAAAYRELAPRGPSRPGPAADAACDGAVV